MGVAPSPRKPYHRLLSLWFISMQVLSTSIPDVLLIEPRILQDERGFFMESFHAQRYAEQVGITLPFVQDNHSLSRKGVLRGLHLQCHFPQGKLVRVIRGSVFDVAVDLRHGSATFGQWTGALLSAENRHQLWIPPGFAHGFLTLSEEAECEYKCTDIYRPDDELTVAWDDADLAIQWPIELLEGHGLQLSAKDKVGLSLKQWVSRAS